MINRRNAIAGALGLVCVVALSACGSSSTAPATSRGSSPSSKSSSLVTAAAAAIAKHHSFPTFTPPGPAIDIASLKGKTVLVVAHDQVADELVGIANGIKQAGSVAGINVSLYNANASVSAMQEGFNQGIQQHVSAIIIDGISTDLIQSSVEAADSAHIPVIAVENSSPNSTPGQGAGTGIYANAEPPDYTFGELIADAAIVATHGHVNAAILTFNNPIAAAAVDGMKAVLGKCSTCSIVATSDIEPASWPIDITPQTETIVRSHPGLNYILTAADTMGIFAASGIRQAGYVGKIHVMGVDGSSSATLALTQSGTVMVADPGSSPTWLGWAALDQAMRAMLHKAPANPLVPYRYIDTADLAGANTAHLSAVYGTSFVAGYEKLWGISGS